MENTTSRIYGHWQYNTETSVYNIPKADDMKKQIVQYSKTFDGTYSDIELIEKLDIPRATYYKYKKEIKDKKQTK